MVINTKIRGSTFANSEQYIKELKEGDILSLEREPNNKFDSNAIKVIDNQNRFIGYIGKDLAMQLSPQIDSGSTFYARVQNITGGGIDKPNIGCNIMIINGKNK